MDQRALRASCSIMNAFGRSVGVDVEWIPLDVTHLDPGFENAGWRIIAHETPSDPPVRLRLGRFGNAVLCPVISAVNGNAVEFREVGRDEALEPGNFRVISGSLL